MKLQIVHRTHYAYAGPVKESFNEVRLKPVSNEHQRCESFVLRVLPSTRLRHYEDFYANCVHHFDIAEPHTALSIEADCTVVTNRDNWLDPAATPFPLGRVAECARMERCFDYLQPSAYVDIGPDVWRLALDVVEGRTDVWQAAQALMHWVHANLAYAPRSTNAHTRMSEALARRTGVCQDFSHVLIGLCRAIQIPALYVSGYFYTPNTEATHAWVEVFLPEIGWRGLDPTHDCQPDERYVKTAVGRDYADVPPTRGHYKGTQDRRMEIGVRMTEIPA